MSVRTQPGQTEFTAKFRSAAASCEINPIERCLGDAVSWRPSIGSVGQLAATAGDIDYTRCAAFDKQRGERPRDAQRSERVGFKRLSNHFVASRIYFGSAGGAGRGRSVSVNMRIFQVSPSRTLTNPK